MAPRVLCFGCLGGATTLPMLSAEEASCAKRVCFSGGNSRHLFASTISTTRREDHSQERVRFRIEFIRIVDDARKYVGCIRLSANNVMGIGIHQRRAQSPGNSLGREMSKGRHSSVAPNRCRAAHAVTASAAMPSACMREGFQRHRNVGSGDSAQTPTARWSSIAAKVLDRNSHRRYV
jgi:hypothetical protein